MKFSIVTLFPEMFAGFFKYGVIARAFQRDLLQCAFFNPRDFTEDKHQAVDDRPYGGGPGMVMQVAPLRKAIQAAKQKHQTCSVIYVAPEGKPLDTETVRRLANASHLILVSGRYEGIDQRIIDQDVDEIISIGDYVLTGGELPIMVLIDAVARWLPGVLGEASSKYEDAFTEENGGLLDCPHYSRPPTIDGQSVPDVLLSGDHAAIEKWRLKQKLGKTWQLRPDLLEKVSLNQEAKALLDEFKFESEIKAGE